jgi:4-carboxymuconolactone decarboxylase
VVDEQGRLVGPFNARLLDPVVGRAIHNLGAKLRFETPALSARQRELAILEVAAAERCDYEWTAHRRAGRAAGLSDDEVDAIRRGTQAATLSPEESLVRRLVRALLVARDIDDELFDQARERIGLTALFDLVSIVGHYRHTALALRVWRVPLAAGEARVDWGVREEDGLAGG